MLTYGFRKADGSIDIKAYIFNLSKWFSIGTEGHEYVVGTLISVSATISLFR